MIASVGQGGFSLPPVEPRLQRRYQKLVKEQLQLGQRVAAGVKALPGTAQSFASTQGAWRFFQNQSVTLSALAQPLREQARASLAQEGGDYGLVMHDWSHLNYHQQARKRDRVRLSHSGDEGYELQTALLVSDRTGQPLAPICQNLVCADGLYTTRSDAVLPVATHLDELSERIQFLEAQAWGKPLVHVVDREGDSVGHYRQWQGQRFVVRAKARQRVQWEGQSLLLGEVAAQLHRDGQLAFCREVEFRGRVRRQYVGETVVVLSRRTRQKRKGQKPRSVAAAPVSLRLIVSEVRAANGRVLAVWLLLSNVVGLVNAATLALWYYWRWRIESFFKLLKSAGHQVEHWQQERALAVAKRLLVVSMACVLVWQLARAEGPAAAELRTVLVRLSGRQMKRAVPWTTPALLAGLWVLLAMLDLLEHYKLSQLQKLARMFFKPGAEKGPQDV